jgi:hypothetical protein
LRVGVAENDGGVVYVGVGGGLVGLGDSGNGDGWLAVHEDGHEVGSVAAEVKECSGSVLDGLSEPGEPLWDDDLAGLAELAGLGFIDGIGVGIKH